MARITQWERHIGRRLRLRDLFVFFTVADCGSMAKAAAQLGVSTPSVSDVIADLEHALGVRLLDRTPKGVVPTRYGQALLSRSHAAFDELRQGIRDIEFISDPAAGEIRIGCSESLLAFLGEVIERLAEQHPRMRFHVQQTHWPTVKFPELHQRQIDLAFARLVSLPAGGASTTSSTPRSCSTIRSRRSPPPTANGRAGVSSTSLTLPTSHGCLPRSTSWRGSSSAKPSRRAVSRLRRRSSRATRAFSAACLRAGAGTLPCCRARCCGSAATPLGSRSFPFGCRTAPRRLRSSH
jgi:DNA-binding transcriptional LysR family regulator